MPKTRTFKFTDRALKGLPTPPKPDQLDYFDTAARGLGLRISYGGRKSFFCMYTREGKRQRRGLGEFGHLEDGKLSLTEARKRARAQLGQVAQGHDPAAGARAARAAPTVQALAADFIEVQRRTGKKSVNRQEQRLARGVLPIIGKMKARDVTRTDVKKIMIAITERGAPVESNRTHETVRAMFAFAIEEEGYGLESNPAANLKKHRNPEQARDRWLTTEEIGAYWKALDHEPPAPTAALRLCLLTAARQQNVLGLRLDQLALEDRLWILPARTTKTGKGYRVPLSTAAVGIIEARIAEVAGAAPTWLFPKRGGDGPATLTFTRTAHRRACKRAGIIDYLPHDHRHTFATHAEQMGISRLVWDGLLGHSANGMADLYSGHDFADQRLACMEKWADRIAAALGDNVVNLDGKREKSV